MRKYFAAPLAVLVLATACGETPTSILPTDRAPLPGPVFAVGSDPVTGATIAVAQDDYSPGESVIVEGSGWAPGETVQLYMTEVPDTHGPVSMDVQADENGAFSVHFYDVQDHDIGSTFTLTATGQTSGSVATLTFTDANYRATVSGPPSPPTYGIFYQVFSGATCTGTPTKFLTINVTSGTFANITAVAAGEVIKLHAPTIAGWTFVRWEREFPVLSGTYITPTTNPTPCLPGDGTTDQHRWRAVYTNIIATTTVLTVTPSTQQYSDLVDLKATISPSGATGSVQFQRSINGGAYGNIGAPVAVVADEATLDDQVVDVAAGTTVSYKAVFTGTGSYGNSEGTAGLTVTKEDATLFGYTGPSALGVNGAPLAINAFAFDIKVEEKNPETNASNTAAGDITKVTALDAKLVPIAGGSSINLACTLTNTSAGSGYAVELTFNCKNPGTIPVGTYEVMVDIPSANGFYTGSYLDAFTVYDPSLGFATGGGHFLLGGDKVNFGFNMKYNKNKSNLQGNFIAIRHHADGTTSRMKSNALGALAIQDINGCGIATFNGKANYTAPDGTTTGNHSFTVYAEDCNNPGTGMDYIWIDGPGNLDMAGPASANKVALDGGNNAIPHKAPGRSR